jgi:hypothetical protein
LDLLGERLGGCGEFECGGAQDGKSGSAYSESSAKSQQQQIMAHSNLE